MWKMGAVGQQGLGVAQNNNPNCLLSTKAQAKH